jgi:hypothetical protein
MFQLLTKEVFVHGPTALFSIVVFAEVLQQEWVDNRQQG